MQTRLSRIFNHMKLRCYNANHHNYKNYGARGIKLCDEWNNRELAHEEGRTTKGSLVFKKWALENGYADNLTIDRIDVNKNYSPENCRWVSVKFQENNKRTNHFLTYKGETKTMKQWCEELKLNYNTVRTRIRRGCSVEIAFETK